MWFMFGGTRYLEGTLARFQAESIRNWQLPPDTELIGTLVFPYHLLRTHPRRCYYETTLTLESSLSADEIMDHYEQFSAWGFRLRREIEQLETASADNSTYKVTFGISDSYNC